MTDLEFVKRVAVVSELFKKENLIEVEENQVMDDFVEWVYKQYGLEFRK